MKFWEILKDWVAEAKPEPTPMPIQMTDEKNTLVIDDQPDLYCNPDAERIRQSLLAAHRA